MFLQRILYHPFLGSSHLINLLVNHLQKLLDPLPSHTTDRCSILVSREELLLICVIQQIHLIPHLDHAPRRKSLLEM